MTTTRIVSGFVAVLVLIGANPVPGVAQTAPTMQSAPEASRAGRSLGELLRTYATILPLDIRLDPSVSDVIVEADVAGLSPAAALREVLLASGVDYVMVRRGDRYSLVAGDASAAVDLGPLDRQADASAIPATEGSAVAEHERKGEPADEEDTAPPTVTGTAAGSPQGAGVMSDADLLAVLTTVPPARHDQGQWVALPFPDENGQAIKTWRPAGKPSMVELPFTDATGQPVLQQIPTSRPVGYIELPFPDKDGQPLRQFVAPAVAPATNATTPGVVVGAKPPDDPLR